MPGKRLSVAVGSPELTAGLQRLRTELAISTQFPAAVLAEAAAAVGAALPALADRTDLELVTLDPAGSVDLDQALHLARRPGGFVLHYAIADVANFVHSAGLMDAEARHRGQTLYAPDQRIPLHPLVLSEGAASLLPGQLRPALIWTLDLDDSGLTSRARVERGLVRSRAKLDYGSAQAALDAGRGGEQLELLRVVGELLREAEVARGGVSLAVPEQEVVAVDGTWSLVYRAGLPIEDWNAQLSLATGRAAAELMLQAGLGILRTLPPAPPEAIDRLRRTARALGIDWPRQLSYSAFVRGLDSRVAAQAAMLNSCTSLFRGAGYQAFIGAPPEQPQHAAIAAPYAHVTAPLRRLVDRFGGELCLAAVADRPVPEWVLAALSELPELMAESGRRASKFERGLIDLVEAQVLASHVGERFVGVVVQRDRDDLGTVQLAEPAIEARVRGVGVELGATVEVRLVSVNPASGRVEFAAS